MRTKFDIYVFIASKFVTNINDISSYIWMHQHFFCSSTLNQLWWVVFCIKTNYVLKNGFDAFKSIYIFLLWIAIYISIMNSYRLSQTKKEKKKPTSDVFIIDITKWTGSNSAFHMLRNYVIENTKICSIKQLRNIMATEKDIVNS